MEETAYKKLKKVKFFHQKSDKLNKRRLEKKSLRLNQKKDDKIKLVINKQLEAPKLKRRKEELKNKIKLED
jgi:hypothetical protein